jgi:succinate dehydrogenase / fumarate reductase, membrane anchor subunit
MSFQTPLGRVKGLGSAKDGTHHFIVQRLSAIALIPLTFCFVFALIKLIGADYATVVAWFKSPFNALMLISFILMAAWHGALGAQVVIEDYIHCESMKIFFLIIMKLAMGLTAIAGVWFVVLINLRGGV